MKMTPMGIVEEEWFPDQPDYGGIWRARQDERGVDISSAPSYLSNDFASRTVFRALFVFARIQAVHSRGFDGTGRYSS
ncbi:hypothetical protein [Mesorhizobium shangrilense]|uniref:Uncharacterized protein n=1 Tax=Mesorhizobium shangrilense TaxID=460060 RepID=A0ABV2DPA3_9HYPH